MKHSVRFSVAAVLVLASWGRAGEMKEELKLDGTNPQLLKTMFSIYGYRTRPAIFQEKDGLRFRLPASGPGVPPTGAAQSGIYSYFALAGDCEVSFTYELLSLPLPQGGYGCSVGLAFDAADEVSRGSLQRILRSSGQSGFYLQSNVASGGGKTADEERFVQATAKRGRIGLRRVNKELIFLAAEAPTAPLQELDRLPFTDQTIRVVRLFADTGGSPVTVDARVKQIDVRAEEMTGGVPEKDLQTSPWWWLLLIVPVTAIGGLLFWFWRSRQVAQESG